MVKISWFGQKECLKFCAIFLRDGVEEMMRNASCFINLFHVKSLVTFFQKQVSQTPLHLYSRVSYIWTSKYPTLHMNAHKTVIKSMAPKLKWLQVGVKQHLANQSLHSTITLHPFGATTCPINHFGSTQESFFYRAPILVIHSFWFFVPYVREISYKCNQTRKESNSLNNKVVSIAWREPMEIKCLHNKLLSISTSWAAWSFFYDLVRELSEMDKFVGAGGIRYNCAVAVVVVILLWSCSVLPAAWAQDPAGL
jgi:hypothetical protein